MKSLRALEKGEHLWKKEILVWYGDRKTADQATKDGYIGIIRRAPDSDVPSPARRWQRLSHSDVTQSSIESPTASDSFSN